jgi:3-oxoacyl-[acyl-carrier-protein] synthase-3
VTHPSDIYLRSIAAELPEEIVPLQNLRLRSSAEVLAGFGFTGAAIAKDLDALTLRAAGRALSRAGIAPNDCGALLYAGALATSHTHASESPTHSVLDRFCYQASWLQETLGLDRAMVSGIAQQGCAGFFSALRQARALLVAEPELNHVLCVGADAFGPDAQREILYNVVSDAACAAVVSRDHGMARWIAYEQTSKGYYWDVPVREAELIAAYFPTARLTIQRCLAKASLSPEEIDMIIPTGVNATSWPILLRLCGFHDGQLYQPEHRFAHTIAADSVLYLDEAHRRGLLRPGMRVLLFTYGFGSSWCAIVLEMTEEVPR